MGVAVASGVTVFVATGVAVTVVVVVGVPDATGVEVTVPLGVGEGVPTTVGVPVPTGVGVSWLAEDGRTKVITTATKTLSATPPAAAIQIKILMRSLVVIITASFNSENGMKFCAYIYKPF